MYLLPFDNHGASARRGLHEIASDPDRACAVLPCCCHARPQKKKDTSLRVKKGRHVVVDVSRACCCHAQSAPFLGYTLCASHANMQRVTWPSLFSAAFLLACAVFPLRASSTSRLALAKQCCLFVTQHQVDVPSMLDLEWHRGPSREGLACARMCVLLRSPVHSVSCQWSRRCRVAALSARTTILHDLHCIVHGVELQNDSQRHGGGPRARPLRLAKPLERVQHDCRHHTHSSKKEKQMQHVMLRQPCLSLHR